MAYRLRSPDESVPRALRRLARKELRSAREELGKTTPPHDEAIHEARKSLKKVRAIVELIAADAGRGLAGSEKRLRAVHHTLSQLRDADAMLEILTKLRKMHPHAFDEHTFARMRRRLTAYKQTAMNAAQDDGVWKAIDRALRALRRDGKRWRPAHRRFGAIAAGTRASYRRGRKALARATQHQRATDYHGWRKAMKSLWYQLRLIELCSPAIRADVRALHLAEAWLGEDHNAVILCAELSKDVPLCDLEGLRRAANGYQYELRQKAIAKTARIYRRTPSDFVRRLKRAWNAWKRRTTDAPPRGSARAAA